MSKTSIIEKIINSPVAGKAGVPQGYPLRRWQTGEPALDGGVMLGGEGRIASFLGQALAGDYDILAPEAGEDRAALLFDATSLATPDRLRELYDYFHPQMRSLRPNARIVVVGTTPELLHDTQARITARALEGFVRSLAKELRKGATANLVWVDPDASREVESTVRFFLSGKSAFVDGQVVRVSAHPTDGTAAPTDWARPAAGRLAVVTGAARGIGATIAEVLARDGAQVICVDVPAASEHLSATANRVGGTALALDVTDPAAAQTLARHARERYSRNLDVIVHNAGITRDKLLANMKEEQWEQVLAVNLIAPVRITEDLIDAGALAEGAAVIGVSSMAGISGNRGQTNYATTKAGIIGLVDALRAPLADLDSTINAVAPGFIETAMTDAMPTLPREVGRRSNSLQQGGLPVDVAEAVAFFASRSAAAVTGNTLRVCGQNILGA